MSTYLYRLPEGYVPMLSGSFYHTADLPENAPVESYFRVYSNTTEYYKKTESGFEKVDSVPYKWEHLKIYTEHKYIPSKSYYYNENGEKKFYSEEISTYGKYYKNGDSKEEKILNYNEDYVSCGGCLRDDYIRNFNNTVITGRGIPKDATDDVKAIICTDNGDYGKYCGFDMTYATLSDLISLCDAEIEKCKKLLNEKKYNDRLTSVDKKIDELLKIARLEAGIKSDSLKDLKTDEDTEDMFAYMDDEYDSCNEEIEESLDKILSLQAEIGRLRLYADLYEIYSEENIRFVYYLA